MHHHHRIAITSCALLAAILTGCTTTSSPPADTDAAGTDAAGTDVTGTDVLTGQIPDTAGPAVTVTRVIDGDTIIVTTAQGHENTVRLIGVDTPETVKPDTAVQCFGPQASEYTTAILTGNSVRLETDPAAGDTDRYNRQLAYVWTVKDRRLFNLALIEAGAAREYTYQDTRYRYRDTFRTAQTRAQDADHGLWGHCDTNH